MINWLWYSTKEVIGRERCGWWSEMNAVGLNVSRKNYLKSKISSFLNPSKIASFIASKNISIIGKTLSKVLKCHFHESFCIRIETIGKISFFFHKKVFMQSSSHTFNFFLLFHFDPFAIFIRSNSTIKWKWCELFWCWK